VWDQKGCVMDRLPPDTRIGAVHLTVADLAKMTTFYQNVIGFGPAHSTTRTVAARDVTGTAEPAEESVGFSSTGAPPYDLVLHQAVGSTNPRRAAGLYHFAVLLPAREDLAGALRHLIEVEAPIDGASDHSVSEAIYLHDPEGNGIEIYADRPRARWPVRDGRLEMTTGPLDVEDLFANGPSPREHLPAGTRIGHMHLRVNDLNRAEAFYAGTLGFDVMVRGYPGALFVAAGGYHHHIGLNTWAGPLPPAQPDGLGLRYFTLVLPDQPAQEAVLARARSAGITPQAEEGGGLLLRDPDGIGVMLTS
jgi:catechol 2,3-dioxygenase